MNRNISKTNLNLFLELEVYNDIYFLNQLINLNLKMKKII